MISNKLVEYKPNIMWFDYQALFDKIKNIYLKEKDNIQVKHIDFNKNQKAHDALSYEKNKDLIQQMINGDFWAINDVIKIIGEYIDNNYKEDEIIYDLKSYNIYQILEYNFRHLLGIVSSILKNKNYQTLYL